MEQTAFIPRIILASCLAGLLISSPWWNIANAKDLRSDLKSDLELELEGYKPGPSHSETPRPSTPVSQPSAPAPKSNSNEIDARIERAQAEYDRKQYDAVVRTLTPMNDLLPRSGLLLLARAYAAKGDSLNEIRILELCIAKNAKDYVVRTMLGNALLRVKGRLEDALAEFQEARRLNPRYRPAYEALLKELEKKGELYESRNVVNDMITTFGRQPEFLTTLCRLYATDGFNKKNVEEICEEAIDKDPKKPENHVYLGLALKEREENDRAQVILSRAAQRFPASESVHSAMGEIYIAKKDYIRAYEVYKKASSADPKSPRAWVGYANAAFKLQKYQESLTAYIRACKTDRQLTKDFRSSIGELRVRKDVIWQSRFEMGISECG